MPLIDTRVIASALRVLARGNLARYASSGTSEVERFEGELANFLGVRHVLGVNSGTSALICSLVGAGVGPGDEVIVPAYTWVSTAAAPLAVGAAPVLTEIDWSLTIDPNDIRKKITPRTKAIIVVHMLNLVCDMDAIMAIAKEHNLIVIEDACQAVGVTYRGRRTGTIGHVGAFSFQEHKNIQSGEGGAVLTNQDDIHARSVMYHDVGSYTRRNRVQTNEPLFVGVNYRMPNLSAAILRPQLKRLDAQLKLRKKRRSYALEKLSARTGAPFKVSPHHDPEAAVGLCVYFDDPAEARSFGSARGIAPLIDTGRHVYTNWESILTGRTSHSKLDPYGWARSEPPNKESCPKTLEILSRTCSVGLFPDLPMAAFRVIVNRMAC
ncbi:MAG: DegT/DnrJ/EryC1/StrS family aminotransferase [Hyphomicrobiaceae bacterium]